jgi:hypothetical protein
VIEYGEWLLTHVLKEVPHRQWVFSIPKRLRIYFLYDRKTVGKTVDLCLDAPACPRARRSLFKKND